MCFDMYDLLPVNVFGAIKESVNNSVEVAVLELPHSLRFRQLIAPNPN